MKHLFFNGLCSALIVAAGLVSCSQGNKKNGSPAPRAAVSVLTWGEFEGKPVYLFRLSNQHGVFVTISNYGGIISSWFVPDKQGRIGNIVLGFDSLSGYLARPPYFGALVGRYANRIAKGKFSLGGKTYSLALNNGLNHLHGGLKGFDKVLWNASFEDSVPALTLTYMSRDGEEGYPGNLFVQVVYRLTDDNALSIEYSAMTDKPTPINLTNHSYFNLTGDVDHSILDHTLLINADYYTPVDSTLIPTGAISPVKGTVFDFRSPIRIGARIQELSGGYDHNFLIRRKDSSLQKAAELFDSESGRKLEVFTTEPGIQFYSGNFLNGTLRTPAGKSIAQHSALCLETQHFPDSPNEPTFPSTILNPGSHYHSLTEYKVSVSQ